MKTPIILELSNYVKPIIVEKSSQDYVLNGEYNSYFNYIQDRYDGSPTNQSIINGYSEMIYGKGLTFKYKNPESMIILLRTFPKKDVKSIVFDFKLFGSAVFQVIYDNSGEKISSIAHLPRMNVAPSKFNDDGEITSYWVNKDWKKKANSEEYPAFGYTEGKKEIEIYEVKPYSSGKDYYANPDYQAALQYANLEEEISNYAINHIKNGLSAGFIINFNNGEPETEEIKEELVRDVKRKTTSSSNSGTVVISFNDSKETAPTVEAFPQNANHEQWQFWTDEARRQIIVGHRLSSPLLLGIRDNSGLGNNAEELESSTKLLMWTYIIPKQEIILDAFMDILRVNGVMNELEFIPLIDSFVPKVEKEEVVLSLSEDDVLNSVADGLIQMGEDEGDEYQLIQSKRVDSDQTVNIDLAKTFSSSWKDTSEQDTPLFKVRYAYAPVATSANSREFCKKMVQANKVYRKEDIISAGDKVVNPGLGARGADTYDIWLYKGGARCHHFWERRIYLRKNNEKITVTKALEILNDLEPSERKDNKFEQNPPEVAKQTNDLPNNGFLN